MIVVDLIILQIVWFLIVQTPNLNETGNNIPINTEEKKKIKVTNFTIILLRVTR